jgi:hypothetical protein
MLNWKPNGVLSYRHNVEDINTRQARILSLLDRITEASDYIVRLAKSKISDNISEPTINMGL